MATCSRGQAVALTVFIFSSIFFTSLAIAFVRPFTIEEAFGKVSTSYIDHCAEDLHPGLLLKYSTREYLDQIKTLNHDFVVIFWKFLIVIYIYRFEQR